MSWEQALFLSSTAISLLGQRSCRAFLKSRVRHYGTLNISRLCCIDPTKRWESHTVVWASLVCIVRSCAISCSFVRLHCYMNTSCVQSHAISCDFVQSCAVSCVQRMGEAAIIAVWKEAPKVECRLVFGIMNSTWPWRVNWLQ